MYLNLPLMHHIPRTLLYRVIGSTLGGRFCGGEGFVIISLGCFRSLFIHLIIFSWKARKPGGGGCCRKGVGGQDIVLFLKFLGF